MKTVRKTRNTRSSTTLKLKEGRNSKRASQLAAGVTCAVMSFSSMAIAADGSSAGQRLVPFGDFIASVAGTQAMPQVAGAVASPGALPTLKSYTTGLYAGVDANAVKHSFLDANNTTFDCIPTSQQPSLRGATGPVPTAPNIPVVAGNTAAAGEEQNLIAPLSPDKSDQIGNAMACGTGTIPMARACHA